MLIKVKLTELLQAWCRERGYTLRYGYPDDGSRAPEDMRVVVNKKAKRRPVKSLASSPEEEQVMRDVLQIIADSNRPVRLHGLQRQLRHAYPPLFVNAALIRLRRANRVSYSNRNGWIIADP